MPSRGFSPFSPNAASGPNKSCNMRVVVRIRPMNQNETVRHSKTGLYPVTDPVTQTSPPTSQVTRDGSFVTTDTEAAALEQSQQVSTPNSQISSRRGNKGFLSRLLTPAAKSKFGYVGKTPETTTSNALPDATPVIRNTAAGNQKRSQAHSPSTPSNTNSASVAKSLIAESTSTKTKRRFDFDAVFGPAASQETVYDHSVGDAVRRNIFRGYNTTIIAYGQTSAGKTFTMQGPRDARALAGETVTPCKGSADMDSSHAYSVEQDDGVIPRAIHDLFQAKQCHATGTHVTVELTYVEIYNDELRDLLVENEYNSLLQLRDRGDKGINVAGLTKVKVDSVDHAKVLIHEATLRRTTASTCLNERSSRSHAICTLLVTSKPASLGGSDRIRTTADTITAKLTLVDLAGSERIKESGVVGIQKKESININKDLFVLGKVVSALSERAKKSKTHVPYRDSKLTRLLRDSIGGNCCTVLIACVSPAENNVEESINTLRYAERSRAITNSVKQNVIQEALTPAESVAMRTENQSLKAQVLHLKKRMMVEDSKRPKSNLLDEGLSRDGKSMGSGLSSLQAKLKQAEAEAKEARQHSLSVASTADRWKDRFNIMVKTSTVSYSLDAYRFSVPRAVYLTAHSIFQRPISTENIPSPCLSLEMSLTPSPTEDFGLADDASFQSLSSRGGNSNGETFRLRSEVQTLVKQKLDLKDKLVGLSYMVKAKESQLSELDQDFQQQKTNLQDEIWKQERKRTELEQEVNQMKLRIRLLSSDLKEDATEEQSFSSILRSLSGHKSEDSNREVEMRTNRVAAPMKGPIEGFTPERMVHRVEKELNEEKIRRSRLENDLHRIAEENEELKLQNKNMLAEIQDYIIRDAVSTKGGVNTGLTPDRLAVLDTMENDLNEVMARRSVLEIRCQSLEQEVSRTLDEKVQLSSQNRALQTEIQSLKDEIDSIQGEDSDSNSRTEPAAIRKHDSPVKVNDESLNKSSSSSRNMDKENNSAVSEHEKIRSHAEKMLSWASHAIEKRHTSSQSVCSSMASSVGTEFRPIVLNPAPLRAPQTSGVPTKGKPPMMPSSRLKAQEEPQVVISNLEKVNQAMECTCESNAFSGNAEHVEFYLPKLGVTCSCGKKKEVDIPVGSDPCALTNILRGWQADFLASNGITDAVEFVHAHKQRSGILAKEMRRWRKMKGMVSVKTKSCSIALHIWSRTCKAIVVAVRAQKANGTEKLRRPDFMDVTIASDNRTVSTLGLGSVSLEMESGCEL